MARHEFRRVFVHVNKAMQFAQNAVGNMARGARFAVQINRDVGILEANFLHKGRQ